MVKILLLCAVYYWRAPVAALLATATQRTRANTTAIIITITSTAINQRCISANIVRKLPFDPVCVPAPGAG